MSFFKRLFGLESKDEKLQRKLDEQKKKVINILKKDTRINTEILSKIEEELFTSESIIDMINDLLNTNALNTPAIEELKETKQQTNEIISELLNENDNDNDKQTEENVEIISEEPKTNAELLNELTGNLNNMIQNITTNNQLISNMENKLNLLRSKTADINEVISELKIKLENTEDLEEKEIIINQLQELEKHKENIRLSSQNIKNKISQIQKLVAEQSQQLSKYHQGGGKINNLNKFDKMNRKQLDKIAKSLNLDPSKYSKKKDIQDIIKLITLAKHLPLRKMDKKRLSIIANNYGIPNKSKKVMIAGLKKYKLIK